MGRLWISAEPNGKFRVLLGAAAARERRRLGRRVDRIIARALRGRLTESERADVELMAALANRMARGSVG